MQDNPPGGAASITFSLVKYLLTGPYDGICAVNQQIVPDTLIDGYNI